MRKAVCIIGLLMATVTLTGCGDEDKLPDSHGPWTVEPPSAADLESVHKQEWVDTFEFTIASVSWLGEDLGVDYYKELPDGTREKIGNVAYTACVNVRDKDDWDKDRAIEYVMNKVPGVGEGNAYRIVSAAIDPPVFAC
jgi:hypothetical protein